MVFHKITFKFFVFLNLILFLNFTALSQESTKKDSPQTVDLKDFNIDLDFLLAPYNYSVEEKRDPFVRKSVEETLIEEGMVLTDAQKYEIKNFKILGIIWNHCSNKSRECRAMRTKSRVILADPLNKVHYLKRGDRIGKKGAYIEDIRQGEVVIIEPFRRQGKLFYRSHVLTFDNPSEEAVVGGSQ